MANPSQVYEDLRAGSLEGRHLEASLLSRASRKINRCVQDWDERESPAFRDKLEEALSFNQKLWTFLQVELSNPQHPMPRALRADLLRLIRFIDKTILQLYSGGTIEDLKAISRVNDEIAAGLNTSPDVIATPPTADGPTKYPVDITG